MVGLILRGEMLLKCTETTKATLLIKRVNNEVVWQIQIRGFLQRQFSIQSLKESRQRKLITANTHFHTPQILPPKLSYENLIRDLI